MSPHVYPTQLKYMTTTVRSLRVFHWSLGIEESLLFVSVIGKVGVLNGLGNYTITRDLVRHFLLVPNTVKGLCKQVLEDSLLRNFLSAKSPRG